MSKLIPDALRTAVLPTVETMEIQTQIIEPLVASKTFCRFQLDRIGILDSGSAIQIGIVAPLQTADAKVCLPIKTGIHSAVKRAVLRIGEKVIAITDEYGKYQTIHRSFKSCEEKSQKEMVTKGCVDVCAPNTLNATGLGLGVYQLRDTSLQGISAGRNSQVPFPQFLIGTNADNTPFFHIKLSELFPMMRSVQLPLAFIDTPCVVELFFNTQAGDDDEEGTLAVFSEGEVEGTKECHVEPTSLRFLCDYLTYSDDRMKQTRRAIFNEGLVIPYEDIVTTSTNFPSAVAPTDLTIVRDLGVSSMTVKGILGHYEQTPTNPLLGKYASTAFATPETLQLRVNDKQVFQQPLVSESEKENHIAQMFGTDMSVLNAEYSLDMATNADHVITNLMFENPGAIEDQFMGHPQVQLSGSQHFIGCDFSSPGNYGVKVGQKPMQVTTQVTYSATDLGGRDVTYYSLVERTMRLNNGLVEVSS